MSRFVCAALALCCLVILCAFPAPAAAAMNPTKLPDIITQDNLTSAGQLKDGVLTLHLYLAEGAWHPYQDNGPWLPVLAFGEEGQGPSIPGPLIRVPEGTQIVASVRNPLPYPVFVHGLDTRPGKNADVLPVMPGETKEVRFRAGEAGTYFYWAATRGHDNNTMFRDGCDSQLNGAFVVDPPGADAKDHILLISMWADFLVPLDFKNGLHELPTFNGKSWPYSTRLTYTMDDTIRWRVINASPAMHPMHMHGAFFTVDSLGDSERDHVYTPEQRLFEVTQNLPSGDTMAMTWKPAHPGDWVFHCHIEAHFDAGIASTVSELMGGGVEQTNYHDNMAHAHSGMAGLVLGIHVLPGIKPAAADVTGPRRQITMILRLRPATANRHSDISVETDDGHSKQITAADAEIGPPLVLYRGQPTSITIINHLPQPTSIHWHGMELESYYDGVVGVSGDSRSVTPPIAPGASFVARMTPPRAGTFIYHTHWHDVDQLTEGEYGPLIVLEPGQPYNPDTDRVFLASRGGTNEYVAPLLINGSAHPAEQDLRAGVKYRFRLINITPNNADMRMRLLDGTTPVKWRAIGKDGAALPAAQATVRDAVQPVSVGETYDFEFEPSSPGTLQLVTDVPLFGRHLSFPVVVQPALATARAEVPEEVKK